MVVVMMLVLVLIIVVMVVVMMLVLVLIIVVVVMVMMMVAAFVVVIVVVMLGQHRRQHICREVVIILHRRKDGFAADLIPRGGDDARLGVVLTQQRDDGLQLLLAHALRAAEQDGAGVFNLVEEEFAEVLDVHAALARIRDGHKAAHLGFRDILLHALDGADDVGELADAARLDEDAIRMILVDNLTERLAEVAHQRAADAAGVHLRHLNTGFLHEAAVNTDFAELVFNEDDFLAGKRLFKQLLNQRRFTRAEEAGKNINFRHGKHLLMGLRLGLRGYAWDSVPNPAKNLRFLELPLHGLLRKPFTGGSIRCGTFLPVGRFEQRCRGAHRASSYTDHTSVYAHPFTPMRRISAVCPIPKAYCTPFFGKKQGFREKKQSRSNSVRFSPAAAARQIRATPVSLAAFATASATAGPTRLSNALGMI